MENERERIAKIICEINGDLIDLVFEDDSIIGNHYKTIQEYYFKIADWHISELAKAEAKGRKEAAREILELAKQKYNPCYDGEAICNCDHTIPKMFIDKCQSILNEGAEVNHAE